MREFCIVIIDSGNGGRQFQFIKSDDFVIGGTKEYQGSFTVEKFKEAVLKLVEKRSIKLNDLQFDVLSSPSERWLEDTYDILKLPPTDSTLILVSKKVKEKSGSATGLYIVIAQTILNQKTEQNILENIAQSVERLLNILEGVDDDTMDQLNKIITLNPNFMGIGVNLNNLFILLKKFLKKNS